MHPGRPRCPALSVDQIRDPNEPPPAAAAAASAAADVGPPKKKQKEVGSDEQACLPGSERILSRPRPEVQPETMPLRARCSR